MSEGKKVTSAGVDAEGKIRVESILISEGKHTPTPWKLDAQDPDYIRCAVGKAYIAASQSANKADFPFIVKAVNSHDQFVRELFWYEEIARSFADWKKGRPDHYAEALVTELSLDGGRRAREALKAAGEEIS